MFRLFRIMCCVVLLVALCTLAADPVQSAEKKRPIDYGLKFGTMTPGPLNAITDVPGVLVGHTDIVDLPNRINTGVTAIVPYAGNIFQSKVPAAYFRGNGFGKMAGGTQIEELGNIETPIILTNTLSIAAGLEGLIDWAVRFPENSAVRSVNGVVGETNDSGLNDIFGRHVKREHVLQAIDSATDGRVKEGVVGAGRGTSCFGFKGGIGTASRRLTTAQGGWTVGVLVQTNFGGSLRINGVPIPTNYTTPDAPDGAAFANEPEDYSEPNWRQIQDFDGSCMIVVATDAPLCSRNLERIAKRAFTGMAKVGSSFSNGSGDYVIAFSTALENRIPHSMPSNRITTGSRYLHNGNVGNLFTSVVEATEEAIISSLFMAENITVGATTRRALDVTRTLELLKTYNQYTPLP